jgi:hypothetical protein
MNLIEQFGELQLCGVDFYDDADRPWPKALIDPLHLWRGTDFNQTYQSDCLSARGSDLSP